MTKERSKDESDETQPDRRQTGCAQESHAHRPWYRLRHGQDRRTRRQGPDRALRCAHQGLRRRPDAAASPPAEARLPQHVVRDQAQRNQSRQGAGGDRRRPARCQGAGRCRGHGQGRPDAARKGRREAARRRRAQGQGRFRGLPRIEIGNRSGRESRRHRENPCAGEGRRRRAARQEQAHGAGSSQRRQQAERRQAQGEAKPEAEGEQKGAE